MSIRNIIIKSLGTFFYVGYLPFIPGTFASVIGIFLYYLLKDNPLTYILFTISLIILGFLVSGRAEEIFQRKDPRFVVIDEVSGMLLGLMFMLYIPFDIKLVIIAFFLFRLLDTFKPYPAGAFQHMKGSLGVMMDDIIAGLYTNIILQVVLNLASFKTS